MENFRFLIYYIRHIDLIGLVKLLYLNGFTFLIPFETF